VDVAFTDGTKDRFDVVVGADGTHSTARRLIAAEKDAEAEWAGLLYWRAVIDDATRPPVMKMFFGDGCVFGIFPGGPGLAYGFAARAAPTRESDAIAGRRQRICDQFSNLGWEPRAFLERTRTDDEFSCTPPEWVRMPTWHSKRVVLLGDALHSSPPFMAQGACLAMEDAIVLADCLSSKALPEAFTQYEARRRPRVELVHQIVTMATEPIVTGAAAASRIEMFRLLGPSAALAPFGLLMEPL
jgi:2-polyprenyl-6-methoxyphenol hydroxylase-like FAD-dependent oxidoreductase